jgi:hypothetical protein
VTAGFEIVDGHGGRGGTQEARGGGVTYPVGSFFLTAIPPPGGWWIGLGQALCGAPSRFSHAGVIIDADGTVVEAEPGGARIGHLSAYAGQPLLVCDGPVMSVVERIRPGSPTTFSEVWRRAVVSEARKLVGTPYSGADYLALALLHLHLPSQWIRRRIESSGHLICSALVDRAYMNAGIHLFSDGRLVGDVMPADLAAIAEDWVAKL